MQDDNAGQINEPVSIRVSSPELISARSFMRNAATELDRLDAREVEKLVVIQDNKMRAVIVSPIRWAQIQQQLDL